MWPEMVRMLYTAIFTIATGALFAGLIAGDTKMSAIGGAVIIVIAITLTKDAYTS